MEIDGNLPNNFLPHYPSDDRIFIQNSTIRQSIYVEFLSHIISQVVLVNITFFHVQRFLVKRKILVYA